MRLSIFSVNSLHNIEAQELGASCTLLTFDRGKREKRLQIMIDCGLNQRMDTDRYNSKRFQSKLEKTNLVLLSSGALEHCGALPYLQCQQILPADVPIYAPSPVVDYGYRNFMDQYMNLAQYFSSKEDDEGKQQEDFIKVQDKVEEIFRDVNRLTFGQKQSFQLVDNNYNVTIWPVRAGKTIGACAWRLNVNMINIIVLPDFSMDRELHLDSLDVDKLLTISHQYQQSLVRDQLDLLVINNPQIQRETKETQVIQFNYIKSTIQEALGIILQQNSILILGFYPNERVLEAIMAIDAILTEHPELQGKLKCDLYANYNDIIEKARGQTDFLGASIVNWRYQEQNHQTPLDPDYLKSRFLTIKNKPNQSPSSGVKIIITTYNSLFYGPLSQQFETILANQYNQVRIFGQPPTSLNDELRDIPNGFTGRIKAQMKQKDQVNYNVKFNSLRKSLLVNKVKNKLDQSYSESQHGISMLSTAYKTGDTASQFSGDQGKSQDRMTEEQSVPDQTLAAPEEFQEEEAPIFEKIGDHESFKSLFSVNSLTTNHIFVRPDDVRAQFRVMPQLNGREQWGIEAPQYFRDQLVFSQKNQQQFANIESDSEQQSSQVAVTKENPFTYVRADTSNNLQINARMEIRKNPLPQKVFNLLLEHLQPRHVHFINPATQKYIEKRSFTTTTSQNEDKEILKAIKILDLPFLEANANDLRNVITRVQVKFKIQGNQGVTSEQSQTTLVALAKQPYQGNYKVGDPQHPQLIVLFKQLKEMNLDCLLGFGQISIDNRQIIISKTPTGFHLEGSYGTLYKQIREFLQQFMQN